MQNCDCINLKAFNGKITILPMLNRVNQVYTMTLLVYI